MANVFGLNPLILSGFAYHKGWGSPVLLFHEMEEGLPFPVLVSESEAEWLIRELQGDLDVPAIFGDFLRLIGEEGNQITAIVISPSSSGTVCHLHMKKGFRKKTLQVEPGDGVLLSIRTGVDICLAPQWKEEVFLFDWIKDLSGFCSFSTLQEYTDDPRSFFHQ